MQAGPPPPYPQQAAPPPKKGMSCFVIGLIVAGVGIVIAAPLAAVAISGVRRYLAAAKTAEAKSSVSAISRAARMSYEREMLDSEVGGEGGAKHALCNTATSVPPAAPAGRKYMPGTGGVDFDTGDAWTGWKCLKFAISTPIYYKYSYTKGVSPIASARGGPVVTGAESFEAAAEGDLDGDGDTSVFIITGKADAGGVLQVSPGVFAADDYE